MTTLLSGFRSAYDILKTTSIEWWLKDPFRESAVIAYYSIFSLPGLLVVVMTLANFFFGQDIVNKHVSDQITAMLGAETARQIQAMIIQAGALRNSVWATVFGLGSIIIGATGVFAQFQQSLNSIWKVKADETGNGIWAVVRVRLFSFGLIVTIAFLLIASLIISAVLSALGTWISSHFSDSLLLILQAVNFLLSFSIVSVLFALMFKYFPDAEIKWSDIWIGSIVTALLFEIGKFSLGFYFGTANPGVGYGAAGSVILIMLWVTYSAMLVLYGAEFTHSYALKYSGTITPTDIGMKTGQTEPLP